MSWKDFGHVLEQIAPIALSVIPGVPPVLIPLVVHGIQTAEAIPGATGAQKKAAALDLVNTGIASTNAAAGKQVIDPTAINAVGEGIDTVVGVVNLINGKPAPLA